MLNPQVSRERLDVLPQFGLQNRLLNGLNHVSARSMKVMMEFVPEKIGRAVVLNVMQGASAPLPNPLIPLGTGVDAFVGGDFVVGIHNWLIGTQLRYLVFDLQDEKEVPADFGRDGPTKGSA